MSVVRDTFSHLLRPHPGWFGLIAALGLTTLGIVAIGTVSDYYAAKQARWLVIALGVMLLFMLPHPRWLGRMSYAGMAGCVALLVLVILPGVPRGLVPPIKGATSWINLGFMNFQPSEAAKVFFVLALAWFLRYRENHRALMGLLLPFLIMFLPVGLMLKQPDLGSALLFAPTLFAVLVAAGAKLRHLGALLGLAVFAVGLNLAVVLYAPPNLQLLKPHQQARIRSMVALASGDTRYNLTSAFQQNKAMTVLGAGGVTGYGAAQSAVIVGFNKLPEDHNDMIFPVIVNRWGLLGGLVTMGLYVVMLLSFLAVAARSKDPFARLSCVGFASMIFTQATINIGMTVGLLPITGITLPFVSYGGSSLLFSFAMLGLVMNFGARRPQPLARPSFEFHPGDTIFQ